MFLQPQFLGSSGLRGYGYADDYNQFQVHWLTDAGYNVYYNWKHDFTHMGGESGYQANATDVADLQRQIDAADAQYAAQQQQKIQADAAAQAAAIAAQQAAAMTRANTPAPAPAPVPGQAIPPASSGSSPVVGVPIYQPVSSTSVSSSTKAPIPISAPAPAPAKSPTPAPAPSGSASSSYIPPSSSGTFIPGTTAYPIYPSPAPAPGGVFAAPAGMNNNLLLAGLAAGIAAIFLLRK